MAVSSAQVSVGTTATLLSATETDAISGEALTVKNQDASVAVILGGASVTSTTGLSLAAGATVQVRLGGGEKLYGITASGTVTVGVLRIGV